MNEVAQAVLEGKADGAEKEVYAALKERKRLLGRITASTLKPGDRVRVVNIRPKRLEGLEGVIAAPNGRRRGTRLPVELDDKSLQIAYGTPMWLLPQCVERI